ncbi:MAG: PEP-CTERM sorting domain-containing protein [Pirellulales bacterium]|nr:PEP-CTERM sorting domain-containing protein [Pirellulales bacterium]
MKRLIFTLGCVGILAVISASTQAAQVTWYRFDKQDNNDRDVSDSISTNNHGSLIGASTVRTTDRPLLSDNGSLISNSASVVLGNTANEGVAISGTDFIFHSDGLAGTGDATLEFVVKNNSKKFASLFWTNTFFNGGAQTIDGHPDSDRFNIGQTDFGSHGFNGDFKNAGAAPGIAGVGGLTDNEWAAIAIVREDQTATAANQYLWRWFIEGNEVTSTTTTEPLPSNPHAWSIGSRGCCTADLLVSEVRFWDEALTHQDPRFLRVAAQQIPEPASFVLMAIGAGIVFLRRR